MATVLVPLKEVERLSPRCIRVLGGNPGKFTLQGTNTYLLGTGPSRLLIDTGEGKPSWIEALQQTLENEKAMIEKVIITHSHPDHIGGIGQLLQLYPGTDIHINTPSQRPDLTLLPVQDGQQFKVEGATLKALHTPGHTPDHMVFVVAEEDAMFTGDNVLGQGTSVFQDLALYVSSLRKMGAAFKGRAYPAHGPVIEDGPGRVAEYVKHRQDREDQLVQCLRRRAGAGTLGDVAAASFWSSMSLVEEIYRDVPKELYPAARLGVLQVLRKLAVEGKVEEGGDDLWRQAESQSAAVEMQSQYVSEITGKARSVL